ncbi:uncharacterized protein LOC128398160 [Panonychus citri]|uniref:uncharacterized protein LOC128398160 n=1 Tax=Panonychus citri TaxID=50023 RepID=UPI002306FB13|nr:uncharacterized protein LOC128398160 [Panonychus citri]
MSENMSENFTTIVEAVPDVNHSHSNKPKKGRPKGQVVKENEWTFEKCIQLLEKRKEMEKDFKNIYHKTNAWKKLIQSLGWNNTHKEVSIKFKNIISYRSKQLKKNTGEDGDYTNETQVGQLMNLVRYFTDSNHKYNPPKVIDSGDCELNGTSNCEPVIVDDVQKNVEFDGDKCNKYPDEFLDFIHDRYSPVHTSESDDVNISTEIISSSQSETSSQKYSQTFSQSSETSSKRKIDDSKLGGQTQERNKKIRNKTHREIALMNEKHAARLTDLFGSLVEITRENFKRHDEREEKRLKLQEAFLKSKGIVHEEPSTSNDNNIGLSDQE